jgi:hypothetical protein
MLLISINKKNTQTHHTFCRTPWTGDQPDTYTRPPLPDNTQQSQETDFHVLAGVRIHNSSKRNAEDPHIRRRGYWDLHKLWTHSKVTFLHNYEIPSGLRHPVPSTALVLRP